MALGPDGHSYTFSERRQQHYGRLMTSREQTELTFDFDASDLSSLLSFSEKLCDPALSLLTVDSTGARAQEHQIETLFAAAGGYVRTFLDGSPLTRQLLGDREQWLIAAAVPLILLGELAWAELTQSSGERLVHPAFAAIKGATANTDWKELYRSALKALNQRTFYLKAAAASIEWCSVRYGYSEQSGYFDTLLDANLVKAVLTPQALAALAYLGAFESLMRHPRLQDLPVRFIGDEWKATERWAKLFNAVVEPQHLRILSNSLSLSTNPQP